MPPASHSPRFQSGPDKDVPGFHVAMVSPEIAPLAKSGGLADMVSGLSAVLEQLGVRVSLVMPAYRTFLRSGFPREEIGSFSVPVSNRKEPAIVLKSGFGKGISAYLIRADKYFDRDDLYGTPEGDYPDNAERFVFFCRAALELLRLIRPQIIHGHDWQSGLAAVFLKAQAEQYGEISSAKTLFTVHNAGYQGTFPPRDWHLLGLDAAFFTPRYLEFYGKINLLKGGVVFADKLTTVSPSYAEEIKTPEQGQGLEGVFQERANDLVGILNGVDYEEWNPETDRFLVRNYSSSDISGKAACKADLQDIFGLPQDSETPLVGMVSRLASQKGFDLLEQSLGEIVARPLQLIILGKGERRYERALTEASIKSPGKLKVRIGFDEPLAHKIEGGADLFLMPSLYEPCGLNQIYSLRYGTVPIVRVVGGLKDTVSDYDADPANGNGFAFGPYEPPALLDAVGRALKHYAEREEWTSLIKRIMVADFSWKRSAHRYKEVYQELVSGGAQRSAGERTDGRRSRPAG